MKKMFKILLVVMGISFVFCQSSLAGLVYQNFEANNGSGQNQTDYGWESDASRVLVEFANSGGPVPPHSGTRAWKITKMVLPDTDNGSYIAAQIQRWDTNFEPQRHDRLTFWIYALPSTNSDDNIGVRFFDQALYKNSGYTVWTSKAAKQGEWARLTILFSQLPDDFNLGRIDKMMFIPYNTGTYYLDDIEVASEDRVYQSFEPFIHEPGIPNEIDKYGWPWFGQVNLLLDDQIVKEGKQSWWLDTLGLMGGTGVKSQEKKLIKVLNQNGQWVDEQSPWHADMLAVRPPQQPGESLYDRLSFWVYSLPENGLDNNMGVQVFDWQEKYFAESSFAGLGPLPEDAATVFAKLVTEGWLGADVAGKGRPLVQDITNNTNRDTLRSWFPLKGNQILSILDSPFVHWTNQAANFGEWTRITLPLSNFKLNYPVAPGDPYYVKWNDINKIQFQVYWTGRYFFDDIRVSKPFPTIDKTILANGIVQWNAIPGAGSYTLEESKGGPQGPWAQIYQGTANQFTLNRVSGVWLRVRWQEAVNADTNPIPYVSDWSDVVAYEPKPVLVRKASLAQNILEWTALPQATLYIVENASAKKGPWTQIYSGPWTKLTSVNGKYYRVRADIVAGGASVDSSPWSPVQTYKPSAGYLKTSGKVIKENDGTGDVITLRGVNLGNYHLIESWMTGIKVGDPSRTEDDWNIREKLIERFGTAEAQRLLSVYQNNYLSENDMDQIYRTGTNLVRLPIYYRAIREIDESTGQWKAGSSFNFDAIDRVVQWCADRGIYVLLDLHGAPGNQSAEMHSGRTSAASPAEGYYHKLFKPNDNTYRTRTVELWQALATRYKTNTTVMGYDLINEPFGAIDSYYYPNRADGLAALWAFYDQIYRAVRLIDTKHIIVMESIPSDKDWDTLPKPLNVGWSNVVYQFHYYGFKLNAQGKIDGTLTPEQQPQYLISGSAADCDLYPNDDKFCGKLYFSRQNEYNVPVLIGEFNAFDLRTMWDLYLQTFYEQNWSWTVWSYKHHPARELWGLYTHLNYNDTDPNLSIDSALTIEQKFSKYDTYLHHEPNVTLIKVMRDYLTRGQFVLQPTAAGRTPSAVTSKWYSVQFSKNFTHTPILVAGIETFNSSDTAGIRMKQLNRKGFEVKIEEDHPGTTNPTEVVSYFALPSGLIQNKTGATVGEAGRVTAYQKNGSQWHTVKLTKTFTQPVVFMQINTYHGRQPAHIRLRNVGPQSFEFQIEEWDYLDQKHLLEDMSYIVLEKGKHQLTDNRRIEVGKVQVTHNWTTVNLTSGFAAAPVVISQCQTINESPAVVTRERNVISNRFEVKLQEELGGDGVHVAETVGYLAAEMMN